MSKGGDGNATGNDRPGSDGRQHGAAAAEGRARVRRLRRPRRSRRRPWPRKEPTGTTSLDDFVGKARQAARRLADGPRRRGRYDDRSSSRPAREGRHPHRRRQLVLRRRHSPGQRARRRRDSLRRRRHQRRRLGAGARLLP